MKYSNPVLAVPYIGMDETGEPTRNWATLAFDGVVDHRRIKRETRKWVRRSLKRTVRTDELATVIKPGRITAEHLFANVQGPRRAFQQAE